MQAFFSVFPAQAGMIPEEQLAYIIGMEYSPRKRG